MRRAEVEFILLYKRW